MKVVAVDNYLRENIPDMLIAENLDQEDAERIADDFNEAQGGQPLRWAFVKPDSYRLSQGVEDPA